MRVKITFLFICVCLLICNLTASAAIETNFEYKLGNIITSLQAGENAEPLLGEAVILMIEYDILDSLEKEENPQAAYSLKASADSALAAAANGAEDAQALAISFCEELLNAKKSIANLLRNPDLTEATALAEDTEYTDGTDKVTLAAGTMIPDGWTLETNANLTASTTYTYNGGTVTFGNGFVLSQIVSGIQGGEHYSLTIDRTLQTSYGCRPFVDFLKYDEETDSYVPVTTTAYTVTVGTNAGGKSDGKTPYSSINKLCYWENDMKFTTPVGCDAIKIRMIPFYNGSTVKPANFSGVVLAVTDEVVTNGSWTRHKDNNVVQNMDGWYCGTANSTAKNPAGTFRASGSYTADQGIQLKKDAYYKLSFNFAQNNKAGSKPIITFTPATGSNPVSVVFSDYKVVNSSEDSVDSASWTQYEVIFTTSGTSALTNYWLTLKADGSSEKRWYDNISITEIEDVTRALPVYKSGETVSYADDAAANGIRYRYIQDEDGKTQMLIRATYDGENLSDVTVLRPGEGLTAGQAGNYDAEYDAALTTKIYLWDGTSLVPVWDTPIVNE